MRSRVDEMRAALRHLLVGVVSAFVALLVMPFALLAVLAALVTPGHRLPLGAELRRLADRERQRVGTPVPASEGIPQSSLRDPVTLRDLRWFVVHGFTGHLVGLFAAAMPLASINALLVPGYWWLVPESDPVASPYPITSWGLAFTMPLMAMVYAGIALFVVPPFTRWHTALMRRLLAVPAHVQLRERVAELTASRAAALEAHGAELRRIERDLHDGTQNRVVAVAMHLGIVERALRRDPASALPLVLRAQDSAADALSGLRDVVRGIYPPVLAERGLDGAIAGLIARCPVPCALTTIGPLRAPAAVESAAYFVVAEALTNIAKHSGATTGSVVLTRTDTLVVEVTDDGHGGADESGGTGLAGIRRRVSAFDGTTEVTSPVGGPTRLRIELPC